MNHLPEIELRSTWQDEDGRLWRVDHRDFSKDSYVMSPEWPGYLSHPPRQVVTAGALICAWRQIETEDQRFARMKATRRLDCGLGHHEDPDHTGQCIHCQVVFDLVTSDQEPQE